MPFLRLVTLELCLAGGVFVATAAEAAKPRWYACIAKASSHTGRYTFRLGIDPCSVYWREIDSHLKIRDCRPPIIAALKPSATDNHSIVWFNLQTGAFYDYLSGVKDRGWCAPVEGD